MTGIYTHWYPLSAQIQDGGQFVSLGNGLHVCPLKGINKFL